MPVPAPAGCLAYLAGPVHAVHAVLATHSQSLRRRVAAIPKPTVAGAPEGWNCPGRRDFAKLQILAWHQCSATPHDHPAHGLDIPAPQAMKPLLSRIRKHIERPQARRRPAQHLCSLCTMPVQPGVIWLRKVCKHCLQRCQKAGWLRHEADPAAHHPKVTRSACTALARRGRHAGSLSRSLPAMCQRCGRLPMPEAQHRYRASCARRQRTAALGRFSSTGPWAVSQG